MLDCPRSGQRVPSSVLFALLFYPSVRDDGFQGKARISHLYNQKMVEKTMDKDEMSLSYGESSENSAPAVLLAGIPYSVELWRLIQGKSVSLFLWHGLEN